MKIIRPNIACPECGHTEFVIRETTSHLYKITEDTADPKKPFFNRGEELRNDENPEEMFVQCAECYTTLEAPIDFFCPHCFDHVAPITGQGGTVFRGDPLYDVGCLNALRAELKYTQGPWTGRILRTEGAVWMPLMKAEGRNRNMTREQILAHLLGMDVGKMYPELMVVGFGKGEPWMHHSVDKEVILPIYGVRTDDGWYFVNSGNTEAEPFHMAQWELVCNWVYKVPNIVVED